MNYVQTDTREVLSFYEIRNRHPDSSLPQGVNVFSVGEFTYARLFDTDPPEISDYQILEQGEPVLRGNQWWTTWRAVVKPVELRLDILDRRIDMAIDAAAVSWGFKDMADAASYVNDPNPEWAAQAQAMVEARSACWALFEQLAKDEQAGKGLPLPDTVVSSLPLPMPENN